MAECARGPLRRFVVRTLFHYFLSRLGIRKRQACSPQLIHNF
jgi:hypothetical protein